MRILIVDDEPNMLHRYGQSLSPLGQAEVDPGFVVTYCAQGADAIAAVHAASIAGEPFAVAFIDMHMPPGIDGRETARGLRIADSDINIVMVTGRADFSPADISRVAGPPDKVFYIAKPFEPAEVRQAAVALAQRWRSDREAAIARAQLAAQVIQLEEQSAELAANESRAMHMAMHDSLTDAPNSAAFQRALAERVRGEGMFAAAMIDLDRFKQVNDTLGHLAGDALIREVCATLSRTAPDGATVARLGGDEFGVLFETSGDADATAACERVLMACSRNITVFGHNVQAGASAGLVVCAAGAGRDPVDVMRRADLALNDAKRAGKGVVRLFDECMDESIRFRRRIEHRLVEAITRDELSLVYQPIVSRDRIEVVGFEALVRWNSAEYGPISPSTFLPIAEESNVIHDLGDWVLATALAEMSSWPGQYVSVNFSSRQFRRPDFVDHVMQATRAAGVAPSRLQIEITERAIFDDADRAADTLFRLRQMGFRIALDDFGTGYSSLYNIRKFALDSLKIDRSFIDGMGRERESAAIVHSIIHLGRALGLEIIAEGVETEAQVQALRIAGASHLQGFFFSSPVAPDIARAIAGERSTEAFDDADEARTELTYG